MNRFRNVLLFMLLILISLFISCKKDTIYSQNEWIKTSADRYYSNYALMLWRPYVNHIIVNMPIDEKIKVIGFTIKEPLGYLVEWAGKTGRFESRLTSSGRPHVTDHSSDQNTILPDTNEYDPDMITADFFIGVWEVDEYSTLEFKYDGRCILDRPPFPYIGFYSYNPWEKKLELELSCVIEPGQEDQFEKYSFMVEVTNENLIHLKINEPNAPFNIEILKRKEQ